MHPLARALCLLQIHIFSLAVILSPSEMVYTGLHKPALEQVYVN